MAILYFYDWAEAVAAVEYWQSLFALVFYQFYEWVVTLNYISTVAEWKTLSLHWVAWWHWKRPQTFSSQYHGIFRWHFHFKRLIATKCSYFLFYFYQSLCTTLPSMMNAKLRSAEVLALLWEQYWYQRYPQVMIMGCGWNGNVDGVKTKTFADWIWHSS